MRVSNLAAKCWRLIREGAYDHVGRDLALAVPGRASFHTFELMRRYERIINFLSRDTKQYFNELEPPSILPIQVIRRPFSTLFRCQVRTKQNNFCIYIKILHIKNDSKEYHIRTTQRIIKDVEITTKLYTTFREHTIYAVPRIVAFFPEEMAIVTEESDGQPLLNLIKKKGKGYPPQRVVDELAQYCHALGGWLNHFQHLTRIASLQDWDEAEFIHYVNIRLSKLEKSQLYIQQGDSHRIRHYLEQLLRHTAKDKTIICGVHGDLGLSNILVSFGKTTVLDFPMYRIGSCYDDLAHVCMRIEYMLYNPIYRRYVITEMKNAFLEGYQEKFDRAHSLFNAYCLRHKMNRLVDLSKIDGLSMIKRWYQVQQFRKYLNDINKNIVN